MIISYISEFFLPGILWTHDGLLSSWLDKVNEQSIMSCHHRVQFLIPGQAWIFKISTTCVYMSENVCTVYKLIWFVKPKLLAMSDSCLKVRLNYTILMTLPSQAQINNISFPRNFHDLWWDSDLAAWISWTCYSVNHFNLSTEKNKMLDKLYLPSDGLFMKPHFIPVGKPDKKLRS